MTTEPVPCLYHDAHPTWANQYLWPVVQFEARTLYERLKDAGVDRPRAIDLGCGNGATAGMLSSLGFEVVGVDLSESGITFAKSAYPSCHFEIASAYDDLSERFGRFSMLVSLEVIEHLYDPRQFAKVVHDLLELDGTAIISTPYHGYLKNLALAVTGKLDKHFSALWDGGHIKFFSIPTLRELLAEAGFKDIHFLRAGRVPPLAKSMVAVARKR